MDVTLDRPRLSSMPPRRPKLELLSVFLGGVTAVPGDVGFFCVGFDGLAGVVGPGFVSVSVGFLMSPLAFNPKPT